ncbi:MAG: Na+ dependent nucleoside transporter [Bacteroidota bacterium]|nr:Na+ dependent nucleoside transporter [Bacteroidota bacterium]
MLENISRGLLGVFLLLLICVAFSSNRRVINWKLVGTGIVLQFVFAFLILEVPPVMMAFEFLSRIFIKILEFTHAGSSFLFGDLVNRVDNFGYVFAFQVLPTIVFFSALTSSLYYLNILQAIVYAFAWVLQRFMNLSGPESLSAAGNIFLGQTESPLLIKPYLANMTRSEVLSVMVGGMATIAGGVLAAYVGFLGGTDPVRQQMFATHLLSASIMSAPAAIVCAKILLPQTETVTGKLHIAKEEVGSNFLDALTLGTFDGLKLAVNVGAMLIVFIAMVALVNYIFEFSGGLFGLNSWSHSISDGRYSAFNLQFILGYVMAPFAWIMGVPNSDLTTVGQLLGEKTVLNEFYAYTTLGKMTGTVPSEEGIRLTNMKSILIATYALCGFANFSSIGIQIGGIGALAPSKRSTLSALGFKALIGGTIASFLTATIAAIFI